MMACSFTARIKTKQLSMLISVLAALSLCSSPAVADWYAGGNLHRANAGQWQSATPANRLATASDWTARILGEQNVREIGLTGLKGYSQNMSDCVTQATSGGPPNLSVSEVAAACAILMSWR